jgi:o-succinylbenzoate synthase
LSRPALHLYKYDLRLRRGIRLGYAQLERRPGIFVAIKTADPRLSGLGEAAPAWWVGDEPLDVAASTLEAASEWISRKQPDLAALEHALRDGAGLPSKLETILGPSRAAACAVATALADLEARRRSQSLAEYLGGTLGPCPTNALVVADDIADITSEVGRAIALDYRTVKIKVGNNPGVTDVARIKAALSAGHNRIRLRLDANRAWQVEDADHVLSQLDPAAIEYIEEPLADPDPSALRELADRFGIAVALDESILCDADVDRFSQACDTIVIKPGRMTGPWAVLARARRAKAAGLRVTMTDSLESCVGRAACLHLARAIGDTDRASGLAGAALLREDLAVDAEFLRGAMIEPIGPGLLPLDLLSPKCLA